MATVPGIMVDIGANVARMQQDMRRLTSMMESGFGQIESMAKKVGGILAGAFSINALVDYAKQAIETGDRMAKMSQSAGVSVEAISSLAYAAKLSNVELEGLAKGLGILSRNMLEAQGGTGEAKDAIKALNLSITDSSGTLLSSDKMLAQVADKFAGMQDGAGKTALAMKLFGRSGAELIPLLNQGSAGLAELRAEAEKMGLVLSEDTAQQMERVNDNFIRLKAASQGAAMVIMAGVAPTLENLTNILIDARKSVGGFSAVIEATAGGLRTLASTGVIAWTVFKDLGEGFNAIAAAAVTAAEGDFSTAWKILNMEGEDSRKMWGETGQVLAKIWDKSAEDALRSATKIRKGLGAAPALPTEDEKNIEKRLKALQEEAEATQLGTDALDLYKKGFAEATAEQRDFALYLLRTIDAYEQSKKSILDLVKAEEEDRKVILENESAIFSMVDALKMQAIATGMSEEETFKFQLILKGASKSIIENADAYFAAIRAAKQYNDQIELVKGVIEETKSPMDRYEERMKEIQSLLDQGFISPQKALQAQAVAWDKMIGKEKETFAERERILIDFGDRVRA